ncbi:MULTISPECIES: hypothetical protein [unclassified Marinovum]
MQDRTINNALLALRRDGGEVQELAEALLALRGVDYLPRMIQHPAKRGQMRRMVMGALSERPMTRRELVAHLAPLRPEVPSEQLYWRTDTTLSKLRMAGLVKREGRVWYILGTSKIGPV